jgi:hypothetical protein
VKRNGVSKKNAADARNKNANVVKKNVTKNVDVGTRRKKHADALLCVLLRVHMRRW